MNQFFSPYRCLRRLEWDHATSFLQMKTISESTHEGPQEWEEEVRKMTLSVMVWKVQVVVVQIGRGDGNGHHYIARKKGRLTESGE